MLKLVLDDVTPEHDRSCVDTASQAYKGVNILPVPPLLGVALPAGAFRRPTDGRHFARALRSFFRPGLALHAFSPHF
ncbi:hypothetical protein [Cupriavidus necator]|uniref:hypothetical protein n=1 Tax=Cupriavidus necator TaxID=106590 RepID=UPI0011BFE1C5|nr:hypothetical protein [Cupriavidus necator]